MLKPINVSDVGTEYLVGVNNYQDNLRNVSKVFQFYCENGTNYTSLPTSLLEWLYLNIKFIIPLNNTLSKRASLPYKEHSC